MGTPKLITLSERLSLFFQRVPAKPIVEVRGLLREHSLDVPVRALATHALAGGDVSEVGSALAEARIRRVPLDFMRACVLDLARDKRDPTQRPVNVVRRAAEPQEVLFDSRGPMEFTKAGKFTWRPWLRARIRVNLATYVGGAPRDLIDIRLKLALRVLYDQAPDHAAAEQALDLWLQSAERRRALAEGTRFTLLDLERAG